jgi:hypothetical protein
MNTIRFVSTMLALCFFVQAAQAMPIHMTFTADNFISAAGYAGTAPTDPVSGTIVWDANSATSPINAFLSVNMTIDGHTYGLQELASQDLGGSTFVIGGEHFGPDVRQSGTNDFAIYFNPLAVVSSGFTYTSANNQSDSWNTAHFSQFSITAVPVPTAVWLFGSALGVMGAMRRRETV